MTMERGLEGRKTPFGKFVVGTGTSGIFSFVLTLLRVYGNPNIEGYSFTPSTREMQLGIKGRLVRMSTLTDLNTSTGINSIGARIAGIDNEPLVSIPPLGVGTFLSAELNIPIELTDTFCFVADRSGIMAGELWRPTGLYATFEVTG